MIQALYLMDKKSGMPMLNQTFGDFTIQVDEGAVSSMLGIIEAFARDLVRGKSTSVPEMIELRGFKIIYLVKDDLPVILVALVDEYTDALRIRKQFAKLLQRFCQQYENEIGRFPELPLSVFSPYKEKFANELENGAFAHIENIYPALVSDDNLVSSLRNLGVLRPNYHRIALLCDGTRSIWDIAKETERDIGEIQKSVDYLAEQGLISLKKEKVMD